MTLAELKAKLIIVLGTDIEEVYFDTQKYLNEKKSKTYPCVLWVLDGATFKKDIRLVPKQPAKTLKLQVYGITRFDPNTQDKITVWDGIEEDLDAYLRLVDTDNTLSIEKQDDVDGRYFPEGLLSADRELGIGYEVTLKMWYCPVISGVSVDSTDVTVDDHDISVDD
jgi:hypothetical protein